ncbi:tripartite tricarboxylate transporter substrate binding protein [Kribbella sindirgiensis]|uniref:tripartite tricarboxylate transporter substrate binding protein n=1 Tax=Kribbella sindirgiensis TaxID=1124744 RepID=UPI0013F47583|nr:tripartite tricarboxylate transporter substrate binding protein [Kribbella sindirgiensis]
MIISTGLAVSACAPEQATKGSANSFPDKPIELVVPFSPGGATDLTARVMADALSKELGVPVNVVNKPGAEQITGVDYVRKARPDGTTLLADGAASSSIQSLSANLPFAWDDRTFIGRLTSGPHVYTVAAKSPYKSLDELIAGLKQGSKKFRTSWSGGATTTDLAMLGLLKEAGVKLSDLSGVPFKSSGDIMQAVAAGNLDFGVGGASSAFAFASSGDVRVLAQTGTEPITQLPDVPTTKELGHADLDLTYWVGLSGPPGLPDATRQRLQDALTKCAQDPGVVKKLENAGVSVSPLMGDEFKKYVTSEVGSFTELRKLGAGQ